MQNATLQLSDVYGAADNLEHLGLDDYAEACVIDGALRQCDQGLDFVESALLRFSIPDAEHSILTEQIGLIRRRRFDPNFYLAIVGEFDSGKSTLINALLGEELLPTGAIPMTSAVTKIHYSQHMSVEFCFRKNGDRPLTLCSTDVPVAEIVAFLKTVMTDPKKAGNIAEIRVGHPSPFLASGIVIVDTPGFDAPQSGHAEITKQVVGQIADCAVVLTPSYSPASLKLVDFLNSYLRPYLHRCVYIVTVMDQLREKDREVVLGYVRSRLEDRLSLSGVAVYPVAAQIKLDGLCSSDIPASERVWVERFQLFEKELALRVKRERAIAVAERIARLQHEALGRIEEHLKQASADFQSRKVRIAAAIMTDVAAFTLEQRKKVENSVGSVSVRALDLVSKEVKKHSMSCLENIKTSIFDALTKEGVTAAYHSGSSLLWEEARATKEALGHVLAAVPKDVLLKMKSFDSSFQDTYARLEQATGETLRIPELPSDGLEFALAPRVANVPEMPSVPFFQGIWDWIFGPDINDLKNRAWKAWEPEVPRYFSGIEGEARDACAGYLETTGKSLGRRISHYVDTYGQIVATIMEREGHDVLRMQMLTNLTQLYAFEAQRQASSLLRAKDDLAALGA